MTAAALLAALRTKAGAEFAHRTETMPWCSVDRSGERHVFELSFPDHAAAARMLADLDDYEFALPQILVVDIKAYVYGEKKNEAVMLTIEALTFPLD